MSPVLAWTIRRGHTLRWLHCDCCQGRHYTTICIPWLPTGKRSSNVCLSCVDLIIKPVTHLTVFFQRTLSDVLSTLAQVFTFANQLSTIERVLLLKGFFRIRWAMIGHGQWETWCTDRSLMVDILCVITKSVSLVLKIALWCAWYRRHWHVVSSALEVVEITWTTECWF